MLLMAPPGFDVCPGSLDERGAPGYRVVNPSFVALDQRSK